MTKILTKPEKKAALKERVKVLKVKLEPVKGWMSDFFSKNKDYDSHYWSLFLRNMMTGGGTDEGLIKALEKYVKTLKTESK
jgi:hypothetical protein